MTNDDIALFQDMLKNTSPTFVKWAIGAILNWKNTTVPKNVYHVTGDRDKVFDFRRIKNSQIIKNGTHIMIFDRADEINQILKNILTE